MQKENRKQKLNIENFTMIKLEMKLRSFLVARFQPTQTSLRRIQDVLKRSRRLTTKQDVVWKKTSDLRRLENVWFTPSWRCPIYDLLKTSDLRRLENAQFATSWKRLIYDVLKMSDLFHLKSSFRSQDI